MSGDEPTRQQIEVLLDAAGAAPSMHNTQPWRFEVVGHTVDMYLDRSRTLPVEDRTGRAMRIGIGAALFNLRVAAAHLGFDNWFGLNPDPDDPELMARMVLAPSVTAVPTLGPLYAEIARRHTDRAPASGVDVPDADRIELQQVAFAEGAELSWLPGDSLDNVLTLVVDADLRGVGDYRRTAERRHWIGGPRTVDGVPHQALGPRSVSYPAVVRDLSAAPLDHLRPPARFELAPVLALLSTERDTPGDQLTAGMALQRVLLTAARHRLSASFLNQTLEYDDLRQRVQAVTGRTGNAHMLIRFLPAVHAGHHHEPTPRRPVADVVKAVPEEVGQP